MLDQQYQRHTDHKKRDVFTFPSDKRLVYDCECGAVLVCTRRQVAVERPQEKKGE